MSVSATTNEQNYPEKGIFLVIEGKDEYQTSLSISILCTIPAIDIIKKQSEYLSTLFDNYSDEDDGKITLIEDNTFEVSIFLREIIYQIKPTVWNYFRANLSVKWGITSYIQEFIQQSEVLKRQFTINFKYPNYISVNGLNLSANGVYEIKSPRLYVHTKDSSYKIVPKGYFDYGQFGETTLLFTDTHFDFGTNIQTCGSIAVKVVHKPWKDESEIELFWDFVRFNKIHNINFEMNFFTQQEIIQMLKRSEHLRNKKIFKKYLTKEDIMKILY